MIPDAAPPLETADDCDETSCVLSNYGRPCCERFRPKGAKFVPHAPATPATPATLDVTLVRDGVAPMKAVIFACGDKFPTTHGSVKVAVTVAKSGTVTYASVLESPTPELGTCVATALRKAKFVATTSGGSFKYPIVF